MTTPSEKTYWMQFSSSSDGDRDQGPSWWVGELPNRVGTSWKEIPDLTRNELRSSKAGRFPAGSSWVKVPDSTSSDGLSRLRYRRGPGQNTIEASLGMASGCFGLIPMSAVEPVFESFSRSSSISELSGRFNENGRQVRFIERFFHA